MSAHLRYPLLLIPPLLVLLAACADAQEQGLDETDPPTPTATPTESNTPSPASPTPTPAVVPADWKTYTDEELGFSLRYPPGLATDERLIDLPEKDLPDKGSVPAMQQRIISFVRPDGVPVAGVSVTPNPAGLALEEWISTVPGWPCHPMGQPTCVPDRVTVAGEPGIRFSLNVLGEPAATVYFAHAGFIYAIGGNVYGSGEGDFPPAISEADFQRVIDTFRVGE